MSKILSDSASVNSGLMRANMTKLYKTVSTSYAFMIPKSLCDFIYRITEIDSAGLISFSEYPIVNTKGVINPGKVYSRMGVEWSSKSGIMSVI
jgi:hypothetical protein